MSGLGRSALTFALLACGCGSNTPEIPDELLQGNSGCGAPEYPRAGIGEEPGDVVANQCFTGYRAPRTVPPSEGNRETIAFSDYYDPTGSKGVGLLLVNTAAVWCAACVAEHTGLPERYAELAPKGLVIFGTLFEDAQKNDATLDDLDRWIENFDTNFPMVADPSHYLEDYGAASQAPLNMVVDPRTMKILRKYVGDQGGVMWPYIEAELDLRSASR